MLDALPYLIDYPYGCTEQTMSRFLPAVITAKTLRDLGLKPETAMNKIFGGIEQSTAAATHPKGKKDLSELDAMTKQGLERLYDFQHSDGGWGWWKEGEQRSLHDGLRGLGLDAGARGRHRRQAGRAGSRRRVFSTRNSSKKKATTTCRPGCCTRWRFITPQQKRSRQSAKFQAKAFDNLWTNRDQLNAYTRALLALSCAPLRLPRQGEDADRESGERREDRLDARHFDRATRRRRLPIRP